MSVREGGREGERKGWMRRWVSERVHDEGRMIHTL